MTWSRFEQWWARLVLVLGLVALGAAGWIVSASSQQSAAPVPQYAVHEQRPAQPSSSLAARLVSATPDPDAHDHSDPDGQLDDQQEQDGSVPPVDQEAIDPPAQDEQGPPDGQDPNGPDAQPEDQPGEGDSDQDTGGADQEQVAGECDPDLPAHQGQQEGLQCVQTLLGAVPDPANIPGVLITTPQSGAVLTAGEPFDVTVQVSDFAAGRFANPDEAYFQSPQSLDDAGHIQGHAHVAVQRLGDDQDDASLPDARDFDFFLGLEDEAAEDGQLGATVPGLEPGMYRIVVNTSSFSHQPVLSPIAQHVPSVDGVRVLVEAPDEPSASDGEGLDRGQLDAEDALDSSAIVALQAPDVPGDGIPPAPSGDDGNGGGRPGAGDGGAGDGRPPAPTSTSPPTSASTEPVVTRHDDHGPLPFTGGGLSDGLLLAAGALAAVGLALLAIGRGRKRSRRSGARYQGRHTSPEEPPSHAAGLAAELDRLQSPPEPSNGSSFRER